MDFGLNRFQHHRPEPRGLDLIMVESSSTSRSGFEEEAAAVVRGVDFDGDHVIGSCGGEREHMFDKVVTPSDVGKLNRLVIPKQHAERYFPLDSSTNEKGLLLNFEDRNGKSWRFRYSYWNSSQSYVMTKGWSRFVKEKRLDAGDIVSFQRGVGEVGRDLLYIDWRRRPELPMEHSAATSFRHNLPACRPGVVPAWSSLVWRPLGAAAAPYPVMPRDHPHLSQLNNDWNSGSYGRSGGCSYGYGSVVKADDESAVVYLRSGMAGGGGGGGGGAGGLSPQLAEAQEEHLHLHLQQCGGAVVYESVPVVVHGNNLHTPPKRSRLRLFGVNMDCPISSAHHSSDECDLFLSSSNPNTTAISTTTSSHQPPSSSSSSTTTTTTTQLQQLPPQTATQPHA